MKKRQIKDWDEQDAYTGWRHLLAYLDRAGVRKRIKKKTHRRERREGRQEIEEQLDE